VWIAFGIVFGWIAGIGAIGFGFLIGFAYGRYTDKSIKQLIDEVTE